MTAADLTCDGRGTSRSFAECTMTCAFSPTLDAPKILSRHSRMWTKVPRCQRRPRANKKESVAEGESIRRSAATALSTLSFSSALWLRSLQRFFLWTFQCMASDIQCRCTRRLLNPSLEATVSGSDQSYLFKSERKKSARNRFFVFLFPETNLDTHPLPFAPPSSPPPP